MREITSISRRTPLPSHPASSFLPPFLFFVFYQNAFKMGLPFIYNSKSLPHDLILCGATLPKLLLRSCLSQGELLGHRWFCTVFISIASSFVSKVSLVRRKPLCQGTWSGVCAPRQWHLSWGLHAAFKMLCVQAFCIPAPPPPPPFSSQVSTSGILSPECTLLFHSLYFSSPWYSQNYLFRIFWSFLTVNSTISTAVPGGERSRPISYFGDNFEILPKKRYWGRSWDGPRGEDEMEEIKHLGMRSTFVS